MDEYTRTKILIGDKALEMVKNAKVIIYGLGGVGSYVTEALARIGVGTLVLVDPDKVDITNINRQLEALCSTIGEYKVDAFKDRINEINPKIKVKCFKGNELGFSEEDLIDESFDYVVDAIDTIPSKVKIIKKAKSLGVKIISATGAANKIDPTKFKVADIYSTSVCPVCKVLRNVLKKEGVKDLKVVYSTEKPRKYMENEKALGSISTVPSCMGLIIASEVIRDLIDI